MKTSLRGEGSKGRAKVILNYTNGTTRLRCTSEGRGWGWGVETEAQNGGTGNG